jgi:hypothetical protein
MSGDIKVYTDNTINIETHPNDSECWFSVSGLPNNQSVIYNGSADLFLEGSFNVADLPDLFWDDLSKSAVNTAQKSFTTGLSYNGYKIGFSNTAEYSSSGFSVEYLVKNPDDNTLWFVKFSKLRIDGEYVKSGESHKVKTGLTTLNQTIDENSAKLTMIPTTEFMLYSVDTGNNLSYNVDTKTLNLHIEMWIEHSTETFVNFDGKTFGQLTFSGLKLKPKRNCCNAYLYNSVEDDAIFADLTGFVETLETPTGNTFVAMKLLNTAPLQSRSGQLNKVIVDASFYVEQDI